MSQAVDGAHWGDGNNGNGTSAWTINYGGESYTYVVDKSKHRKTSDTDVMSKDSSLGLRMQESTDNPDKFRIFIEPQKVMNIFAKFYAEAVGA